MAKGGFFGWFNRGFARTAKAYEGLVARILRRAARYLVIYAAIIAAVVVLYGPAADLVRAPRTRAT
jgi:multidrug efflux pump